MCFWTHTGYACRPCPMCPPSPLWVAHTSGRAQATRSAGPAREARTAGRALRTHRPLPPPVSRLLVGPRPPPPLSPDFPPPTPPTHYHPIHPHARNWYGVLRACALFDFHINVLREGSGICRQIPVSPLSPLSIRPAARRCPQCQWSILGYCTLFGSTIDCSIRCLPDVRPISSPHWPVSSQYPATPC